MSINTFQVGDAVEWTSQAGGVQTTKQGTVIHIVPAHHAPYRWPSEILNTYSTAATDGARDRSHESYLVAVPGKTPRRRARLYWPRVSALVKVTK